MDLLLLLHGGACPDWWTFSVYIGYKGPDDVIILKEGLRTWLRKDGRLESSRRQVAEVCFLLWEHRSCLLRFGLMCLFSWEGKGGSWQLCRESS